MPSLREKAIYRAVITDAICMAALDSGMMDKRDWAENYRGDPKLVERIYEMIYPIFKQEVE